MDTSDSDVRASDALALRRTFYAVSLLAFASIIANTFTAKDNADRAGRAHDFWLTGFYELTSNLVILALFPLVVWSVRMARPGTIRWPRLVAWHFGASIAFSILHVMGMVVLRKLGFWLTQDGPYIFESNFPTEWIYEYRKDIITYALIAIGVFLALVLNWQHQELDQARVDAKSTKRLTLKCSGRTIWIDAATVVWAKAAGNYVEIAAAGQTHLIRSTLK